MFADMDNQLSVPVMSDVHLLRPGCSQTRGPRTMCELAPSSVRRVLAVGDLFSLSHAPTSTVDGLPTS